MLFQTHLMRYIIKTPRLVSDTLVTLSYITFSVFV
jgi:hypothetical protein